MVRPVYCLAALAAICASLLSVSLVGCGGGRVANGLPANLGQPGAAGAEVILPGSLPDGPPTASLANVQSVIKGPAQPHQLTAGWSMGDLPGTVPDKALSVPPGYHDGSPAAPKSSSAVDVTLPAATLRAWGQFGSANYFDYRSSPEIDLPTLMDTGTNELHITGNVTASNVKDMIYAEIGLITKHSYDLAISNGTPSYMFNQSVLMLNAVDAGTPFCAPLDYNGTSGTDLASAQTYPGNSYTFDLMLTVDPLQQYRGVCFLSINNGAYVPVGGWPYGTDNWGFPPPAPLEDFSQCRLIAQLYSYNANTNFATAGTITFSDIRLTEGPLGAPSPHPWPYKDRTPQRTNLATLAGPTTTNQKWAPFNAGSAIFSSPALAEDGTLYFADAGMPARLFAVDSATGLSKWAVPLTLPGGSLNRASPALSNGVGDGVAGGKRIYIGVSGGAFYTIRDDGAAGTIVNTVLGLGDMTQNSPVVSQSGRVYSCSFDGFVYGFDASGNLLWVSPGPLGWLMDSPTLSTSGQTVYVSSTAGIIFGLDASSGALVYASGALGGVFYSTPAVTLIGEVLDSSYATPGASTLWGRGFDLSPSWSTAIPAVDGCAYSKTCSAALGIYQGSWDLGNLYAFNTATHALKWTYDATGAVATDPVVDINNTIYFGTTAGELYAVRDNGGTSTLLWQFSGGAAFHSSPAIGPDGTLYIGSTFGLLYAFNDSGSPALLIDCTAFASPNVPGNGSFYVRQRQGAQDPGDPFLTAALSTNSVYNATGLGFVPGDDFYISFGLDAAAQPNDRSVYPYVPVNGEVHVTAGGLTLDAALTTFFDITGGGWTLHLKPGAYNRVTNDLDSLGWANYTLIDNNGGATITGPWPTNTSATDTVVFASGVQYRPLYTQIAYPLAGSTPPGRSELIYPAEHVTGWVQVNGFPQSLTEGGTVLGGFYDQAALTNTLQADAYCRFEADISQTVANFRVRNEAPPQPWIINNPPLSVAARPPDVLVIARGTAFTLRSPAPFNSGVITVTPNKTLNNAASVTYTDGIANTVVCTVLPVRVYDDPAATNPDANVSGSGPWTVTLNFLLQYGATDALGSPSQTVQLDADYGAAWNDGTAGRIYAVTGSPFGANGFIGTTSIINNQPAGSYRFAIRVTDSLGAQYTYVWPTNVVLAAPPAWQVFTVDTPNVTGDFSSLAVVNGNPAISYLDATNGNLMYVRATNANGTAWGAPVLVDAPGFVGIWTSLAVVNGNPAISYWDGTNSDLKYVRASNASGTAWNAPITVDAPGAVGEFTSLSVVNGNPAISYLDNTNDDLKYVRANNANGTAWAAPLTVDAVGLVGYFTSLAVVNGNPAISYFDDTSQNLKYVRSTNASGTVWAAPVTVDSPGAVGHYTSLAVINGNPAISYRDVTNADLKYVRAADANGAAWAAPLTVDAAGDVGWSTSMEVISGNPAISYYDNTNGDLKYVRATNASGSVWGAPVTVDGPGNVGTTLSLAQVNGNPGISYIDLTNGNLKYAVFF